MGRGFLRKSASAVMAVLLIVTAVLAVSTVPSLGSADRPEITARSAMVYCENTGETVYSKNRDTRIEPFSVTKLMTALLAVQSLPLDQEVTVSEEAASQPGSSMELVAGEILTVQDLIYGAMLPSGNDAAYTLGEAVSGDMDTFVDLMNKTASNIGCTNTHFANPSGLQARNHYSTASDMMKIIKVAFANNIISKAAGTKEYVVDATNKSKKRTLETHISFIKDKDSGVYAAKTGYWDHGNCSIALAYQNKGLSLFVVVFGDTFKQREKDVNKLLTYASEKIEGVKVIGADKEVGKVRIKHGAKTRLTAYTAETGYAYLPKEASDKLLGTTYVMNSNITAPIKAGTVVGTCQIYVADDLVNEIDLIVKESVEVGWFPSYLGISNFATIIIGAVLLIILCIVLAVAIARARYKRRKKKLRKQKILEIARQELEREQEQKERDWHF